MLGFFLIQQIAAGLLQNKERSAATLAASGRSLAMSPTAFHTTAPDSEDASGLMYKILTQLPQETNSGATGAAVMINSPRAPGRRRARLVRGPLPAWCHSRGT